MSTRASIVVGALVALSFACSSDEDAKAPGAAASSSGGPGGSSGGGSSSGASNPGGNEGAICRSGSALDVFGESGAVDPVRYRALAAAFSTAAAVDYRFGRPAAAYHATPEAFPTAYSPGDHEFSHGDGQPTSTWQIGGPWETEPGGYNTSAGQVLYVPDDPNAPGLDALQFLEVASNVVSQKPQLSWTGYGNGAPDQSTTDEAVIAAHGGPFRGAVAMARAVTTDQWTQDAIVAFQDGTLLTTGTHASGGNSNVVARLPAGLVPTAIALTTNNEAALVTVWDPAGVRGGVAVVALGGPSTPGFWGDWNQVYPLLHSYGLFGSMKVLGVVWLDGMVAPTAIAAAADLRWPMIGAPEPKSLDLSDEGTRARFLAGGDLAVRKAQAGYAVVMSRSEKKVAFVDLQPLFAFVNESYFGTRAAFDATRQMGDAPNQWPTTFDVSPQATPTVARVVSFAECPSAVATSINVFSPNNFVDASDDRHGKIPATFAADAIIATEDGTLHVFDAGGLQDDTTADAAAIREVGTVQVGKNPTSIVPLGRSAQQFGRPVDYAVVSRGDRRVDLLHGAEDASTLVVWKTIRDSRLIDPIGVEDVTWFGNYVPLVEVADYAGKQLVGYRYEPAKLAFYDDREIGLGEAGTDAFECAGAYPTAGGALFSSSTNVP